MDNLFVCAMGVGTVFVGLTCIIIMTVLMSKIYALLNKETKNEPKLTPVSVPAAPVQAQEEIANRQEFIAAVSAALAEEMGTDVSAIRILSFKKI